MPATMRSVTRCGSSPRSARTRRSERARRGWASISAPPTARSRSSTNRARRTLSPFHPPPVRRATFPVGPLLRAALASVAGAAAIEHYLASETKGRFIQSLKAYLADKHVRGDGDRLAALHAREADRADREAHERTARVLDRGPSRGGSSSAARSTSRIPPDAELDAFAADRLLTAIGLAGLRRHRLRVRAGRGRLRLRGAAAARRADPDRRLRRRHQRLHDHLGRARRPRPRPPPLRHRRDRRRADRRRRVRQAHHPQPGRAAARARRRIPLAAEQVPAGPELAVRAARALALSLVPEDAADARDAGADSSAPHPRPSGSRRSCC